MIIESGSTVYFDPKSFPGGSNLHQVNTTEIYYMLSGYATLVTGGTMTEARQENENWVRGAAIENGVSRRVVPGDVIVILDTHIGSVS